MTIKVITPPAVEPISLAEAKVHLRVDSSDENDLITALIVAARQAAEHQLDRALITQTLERVLDAFPSTELELGMPPVQSITSVKYYDADEVLQTMDAADYSLDADRLPGWVVPAYGTTWPSTLDTANSVRVRYVAGYGDTASDVPAAIRQWMLLHIGTTFKFREEVVGGAGITAMTLPGRFVDRLLDPFRWVTP